jgi:hypothetical protein|tara:strand:+ start:1832 stop:2047 length:216 start_codon:yes stop_codon:yes gene_type:complete
MAKDIPLDVLLGVKKEPINTMEHRDMIRVNLNKQREVTEQEISLLQGQLDSKKEYLAKIEGGLDVLDELSK